MVRTFMAKKMLARYSFMVTVFACGCLLSTFASTKDLIADCDSCHDGVKQDVPVISGISPFALEAMLLGYVDGSRVARTYDGQDMKTIVEGLSQDEFRTIIAHYSRLPFKTVKQTTDTALVNKGKAIHDALCERCHTEGGSVAEDDSGILAGQWKGFLITEMENYQNGTRLGDTTMIAVLKTLEATHLRALAEYYASQQ